MNKLSGKQYFEKNKNLIEEEPAEGEEAEEIAEYNVAEDKLEDPDKFEYEDN